MLPRVDSFQLQRLRPFGSTLTPHAQHRSTAGPSPAKFVGRINYGSTEFGTICASVGANVPSAGEITGLLVALRRGDRRAESDLAELIYNDLHAHATKFMRRERPDHTLQPTALVHETYLRLMQGQPVEWKNRARSEEHTS